MVHHPDTRRQPETVHAWLAAVGLAGLALCGAIYWATCEPAPRVRVLWTEAVTPQQRAALERQYLLTTPRDPLPEGALAYDLLDPSPANVAALLADPAVADTTGLDRARAIVPFDAEYGVGWMWAAHRVPLLRDPAARATLLAVLAAMAFVGLFSPSRTARIVAALRAGRAALRARRVRRSHGAVAQALMDLAATAWFAGGIALFLIVVGTGHVDGLELAFFSIDRGTDVEAVEVAGHPVYTVGLGLGVRLPLRGNLGASPAALVAPLLPIPLTYWLLITAAIAAVLVLIRHALQPPLGRRIGSLAAVLLTCSVPVVTYTVVRDWPELLLTYCAVLGSVFAPHAVLAALASARSRAGRAAAALASGALVWGLIAAADPAYWPLVGVTLGAAGLVVLCRSDHRLPRRAAAILVLGVAALAAIAPQAADVAADADIREAAGPVHPAVRAAGNLLAANALVSATSGPRLPFTFLGLALASIVIAMSVASGHVRRVIVASAIVSILLGVAATATDGPFGGWQANAWALRDPAGAFAVLSGAWAARALAATGGRRRWRGLAAAALLIASASGPAAAIRLIPANDPRPADITRGAPPRQRWTTDLTPPDLRAESRGMDRAVIRPQLRVAFWPGARATMRDAGLASTDFADAGQQLVTAATGQRATPAVTSPPGRPFNRAIELPPALLCNEGVVTFLQLRYLLLPPGVTCPPWKPLPNVRVDGWLAVGAAPRNDKVYALSKRTTLETARREPALVLTPALPAALEELSSSSATVGPVDIVVQIPAEAVDAHRTLLIPVQFDAGWQTSSGRLVDAGGLLALLDVDQRVITLTYTPDRATVVRAVAMTVAQILALVGLLAAAWLRPAAVDPRGEAEFAGFTTMQAAAWARRVWTAVAPALRPRHWLLLAFAAAALRTERSAVLLPLIAVLTAYLGGRIAWIHRVAGVVLVASGLAVVGARGSQSASAQHDPLFWGVVAAIAFAAAALAHRRGVVAIPAAALGAAALMVAVYLPRFPAFASTFPALQPDIVRGSVVAIQHQLGPAAAVLLGCLIAHAIVGGLAQRRATNVAAAAGLAVGSLLALAAGMAPSMPLTTQTLVVLGALIGIAVTGSRAIPDR